MYKVINKALHDLKGPDGKEINFKKNFLQTEEDRQLLLSIARALDLGVTYVMPGKESIDWAATLKKVRTALVINWNCKPTFKTKLPDDVTIGLTIARDTKKTVDITEFKQLYATVNMGLYNLAPGDDQDIVDDIDIIKELISAPFADRIKILNPDGDCVYDGGYTEKNIEVITYNFEGKRVKEIETGLVIANLNHPKLLNELYVKKTK